MNSKKVNLDSEKAKEILKSLGIKGLTELKEAKIQPHKNKKNAWIFQGEKDNKIEAWYIEYLDKNKKEETKNWQIQEYGKNNNYQTTPLNTYQLDKRAEADYQFIYAEICNTWRQLVDVRFKLLGLLPIISIAIIYNLIDSNLAYYEKLIVCLMGFIFTYGVRLYDLRNTELYDQLISRGKKIEEELCITNGQFMGRVKSKNTLPSYLKLPFKMNKIQHDVGLNIIYRFTFISWIMVAVMILATEFFS